MFPMLAGYVLAFYTGFAAVAAWILPTHPEPALGVVACFVFIPLLVFSLLLPGGLGMPKGMAKEIDDAIHRADTSSRAAFRVGYLAGLAVIVPMIGFCWCAEIRWIDPPLWTLVLIPAVTAIGPRVAGAVLLKMARAKAKGPREEWLE